MAEPSGAVSIAGWLRYGDDLPDADESDTVIVVSGGNVDPETYRALLAEAARCVGASDLTRSADRRHAAGGRCATRSADAPSRAKAVR